MINVLYSVVDRMYIGHISNAATSALTGVGITFPIICIVTAFANLFGGGGAPLFSIAWGRGDRERAETIISNSFTLLIITGVLLTGIVLLVKKPVLYLFGASDVTFPYANSYLSTVSYTHLDVYKRQLLEMALSEKKASRKCKR